MQDWGGIWRRGDGVRYSAEGAGSGGEAPRLGTFATLKIRNDRLLTRAARTEAGCGRIASPDKAEAKPAGNVRLPPAPGSRVPDSLLAAARKSSISLLVMMLRGGVTRITLPYRPPLPIKRRFSRAALPGALRWPPSQGFPIQRSSTSSIACIRPIAAHIADEGISPSTLPDARAGGHPLRRR